MSQYLDHLKDEYTNQSFSRKLSYFEHNLGRYFSDKKIDVLEVGPGMGEFVSFCNSRGISCVDVVDNDSGVLAHIKKNFKIRSAFLMESLRGKDLGRYDLIVLVQVVEHIPPDQYKSTLSTLYSHLKVGGRIIIVVPNGNNPLGLIERYGDLQHYNCFTSQSLRDLVRVSELSECKVELRGYNIPPSSLLNVIRILVQKILHMILLLLMIANGGTYFNIMTPNIMLVLSKSSI